MNEVWLLIIKKGSIINDFKELNDLLIENNELISILVASEKTARKGMQN